MFGPVSVTVTGSVAYSTAIVLDYLVYGVTSIQTVASSTATPYNVEWTLDTPLSNTTSGLNWFSSGSSALGGNTFFSFSFPMRAVRLNVTSGTSQSTVTMTVIQSG